METPHADGVTVHSFQIGDNELLLAELVRNETGAEYDEIVLFRHTEKDAEAVLKCGATIEEWTSIQPIDPKYDYRSNGQTKVLVVIVAYEVFGVFRLVETEVEGPRFEISKEPLNESYRKRKKKNEAAFRMKLERIPFSKNAARVKGWEGKEIRTMASSTVSSGARSDLYWGIKIE
jgi:hypothetical protein